MTDAMTILLDAWGEPCGHDIAFNEHLTSNAKTGEVTVHYDCPGKVITPETERALIAVVDYELRVRSMSPPPWVPLSVRAALEHLASLHPSKETA